VPLLALGVAIAVTAVVSGWSLDDFTTKLRGKPANRRAL
jgi:hypothetical protein